MAFEYFLTFLLKLISLRQKRFSKQPVKMAGSLDEDSLFSLELVVDKLTLPGVQCRFPAVAFRLLDFPTLVIYHVEPELGDAIRIKVKSDPYAKVGAQIPELLDRDGAFAMKKGKSCLLKISANMLLQHLSCTPLYVMILDTYPEVPKMVGNCIVPLDTTMETLYDKICKDGLAMPVVHGEKGIYKIYNLMGTEVGGVILGFRLLSLGVGLIPHLPAATALNIPRKKKPESFLPDKKEKEKIQEKVAEIVLEDLELPIKYESVSAVASKPQRDVVKNTNAQTQYYSDTVQNMATQTEGKMRKIKERKGANELDIESKLQNVVDDVFVTNTVCPPPLFFNSDMEATSHSVGLEFYEDIIQEDNLPAKSDSDDDTIRPEDILSETEGFKLFKPRKSTDFEKKHVSRKQAFQKRNSDKMEHLKKFPLINALIHEIEAIKGSGKSSVGPDIHVTSPSRFPPQNVAPAVVSKHVPSLSRSPSPGRERASVEKYLKRVSTPRHQVRELPSPKTPRKYVLDLKKPIKTHKCQEASKGVPKNKSWIRKVPSAFGVTKTKLTYGMTNTQRLRLEKSNPELLATLQKQEEQRVLKFKEQQRLAELEKQTGKTSTISLPGDKIKMKSDTKHKKPVPTPRLHHDQQDSEQYDTGNANGEKFSNQEYQDDSDYDDGSFVSAHSQDTLDKYIPTAVSKAKTQGYEYEESDAEGQNERYHANNPGFPVGVSANSYGDGYSYEFDSMQPTQRTDVQSESGVDAGEALGLRKMVDEYSESERSGHSFKSARSEASEYMDDTRDSDKHISQIKVSLPPNVKAPKASHHVPAVTNIRNGKRGATGTSVATVEGSVESTAYISRSQVLSQQSYESVGSQGSAEYQKREDGFTGKVHSRTRQNTESVSSYNGEDVSPRSALSQPSKGKEKQEYGSDSFEEDSEFQLPEPKSVHEAALAPEAKFGYTWGF